MDVLVPILSLGSLGFLFGLGLALASRRFSVKVDPRSDEIFSRLPGANCGGCGWPGCMGFTEGLIKGVTKIEACKVLDQEKRKEIAQILGVEVEPQVKTIALFHCGGEKVRNRFIYQGIKDCISANLVLGGQKECIWGCLGFGDCVKQCPFGAISMKEGLPKIDESKCLGCGKCVEICPKKLFSLVPFDKKYYVCCKSKDFGKKVLEVCPSGCIGCGKCEKVCPVEAIHVIDNLAVIDYNKCNNCGECFKVCPVKCIRKRF